MPTTTGKRIGAAFLLAPLVGSFALALIQPAYDGLPYWDRVARTTYLYALLGAYPQTLVFGVPAFFILRPRVKPSALSCGVTGALVAIVPWLLLNLMMGGLNTPTAGEELPIQEKQPTWFGLVGLLTSLGWLAAAGAFAGVAFWAIAVGARCRS